MNKNMTDKEYRSLEIVSYSSLSKLADSPQSYKASQGDDRKDTPEMILGTVVDMLLTQKDRFDEEVYVMTADKPSVETMLTYCTRLAENGNTAIAYGASGYKISPDAVFKKFEKEGKAYYEALLAAKGKMIIDADGMFTANQLVTQLTSNPFTKGYFISDSPDVELRFQVSVIWEAQFNPLDGKLIKEVKTMKVKSMIDVVHIDHANKMITPIDLKTGGEGFMRSYWRWKRYLQASMYTDCLQFAEWEGYDLADYEVRPLKFIFADTNLKSAPMIYSSTELDILAGRTGVNYLEPLGSVKVNADDPVKSVDSIGWGDLGQSKRKGYQQLIAELDWHQRYDIWDYNFEDYQNMGERQINAFGIKL